MAPFTGVLVPHPTYLKYQQWGTDVENIVDKMPDPDISSPIAHTTLEEKLLYAAGGILFGILVGYQAGR